MPFDFMSIPSDRQVNERKLEGWYKYNKVRAWGLRHPVDFQREFMGVELLDLQRYVFTMTWTARYAAWLMCRNAGKTTEGALYTMTRSVLLPGHNTYFLGKTGAQSKEVFQKIEKIAKNRIESFTGSTEFFLGEVVIPVNSDGFSHDPASFTCELFNGSTINTLNSNPDNVRGKRADLVFFDESGWYSDELFIQGENFANQDSDFKMGVGLKLELEPPAFQKQLIYGSSASDTESGYFAKIRNFTREMMMGNSDYFVCDFNVDVILNATKDGEKYRSLITREAVEKQMREDPEKAQRELFNKFSSGSYEGQIVTPRTLMQCVRPMPPTLRNETGVQRFALAWDSARMNDNSVVCVAEFYNDPIMGWCMHLGNVVSFADAKLKNRTPKTMPEQVNDFKKLLLSYNGTELGKLDYENIEAVIGDAGAGGGMIGGVADYMLQDWQDAQGVKHKGLIDPTHKGYRERLDDWPNAAEIFRLVEPRAERNNIFRAMEDMIKLGVVSFPAEYEKGKDYLALVNEDGEELRYDLTLEEQIALTQIEMLKTEITTMCKYVNGDSVTYNYPPEKRNVMHDDRAFSFGLLCWYLAKLRHGQAVKPEEQKKIVLDRASTVSVLNYDE